MNNLTIQETTVNFIAEGTSIEGKIILKDVSRVHGILSGEIIAEDGSTLNLTETAMVSGNIKADVLLIDGYVNGDISAKTRVTISRTGRVVGNITTPSLILEFGAYFEGKCSMEHSPWFSANPSPKHA